MTNPIPTSSMWVTPASLEALFDMLDQYTGEQKSLAMHIAMLTLNTCHKAINDAAAEETV